MTSLVSTKCLVCPEATSPLPSGDSQVSPCPCRCWGLFSALSLASWDLALHARSAARGWSLELLAQDVWGASPAAPPPVQGSAHRPVPSASLSTVPVPSVQRGHHALPGSASRENAGQAQDSAAHCPASITVASFFQFYSVSSLVMVGAKTTVTFKILSWRQIHAFLKIPLCSGNLK